MTNQPRITPNPDGGVILHLPDVTYIDTQVWSVDVGLTDAGVEALRALLAASSAGQAPATDQTALRDRIAEALMRWAERGNSPQYAAMRRPETVRANAYSRADAVLAVLPPPADQAAILHETADAIAQMRIGAEDSNPDDHVRGYNDGLDHVVAELRRRADETQPAHVCKPGSSTYYCPTSGQTESGCHGGFGTCCDRPDLHQPAAGARQDDSRPSSPPA
jgi:hypothetical protein